MIPTLTLSHLLIVSSFLSFAAWKKLKVLDVVSIKATFSITAVLWIAIIVSTCLHRWTIYEKNFFCNMEDYEVRVFTSSMIILD
jgi:hypothetical protein